MPAGTRGLGTSLRALGIICINCLNPLFFSIYQKPKTKTKNRFSALLAKTVERRIEREKNYSSILRKM